MAFRGVDNYVYRDGHRQLLGQATVIISDHHKISNFHEYQIKLQRNCIFRDSKLIDV